MKKTLIILIIGLIVCSVRVNAICEHFGAKCPKESPCCHEGWCSNKIEDCSLGCDPLNSYSNKSCFPLPPCINHFDDFKQPKIASLANFSGNPYEADWTSDFTPDHSGTDGNNLLLNMMLDKSKKNDQGNYQGFGATVSSTRWMLYGSVSARIKTASSALGVVSSFIVSNNTISTIGDEIDLEWVGLNPGEVQTNFYWHGVINYNNGAKHKVSSDTSNNFHIYTINWMPDKLEWLVDGTLIRTLTKESTYDQSIQGYKYPSTLSRISFSVWDGGEGPEGTAAWAGTPTDWSDPNKVYTMAVDWVNITCQSQDTSYTWPPAGYGPQPDDSGSSGNSSTSGKPGSTGSSGSSGSGSSSDDDSDSDSEVDHKTSTIKKLIVPVCVVGGIVSVVAMYIVWKSRRNRSEPIPSRVDWTRQA